jgi:hypothetical protein
MCFRVASHGDAAGVDDGDDDNENNSLLVLFVHKRKPIYVVILRCLYLVSRSSQICKMGNFPRAKRQPEPQLQDWRRNSMDIYEYLGAKNGSICRLREGNICSNPLEFCDLRPLNKLLNSEEIPAHVETPCA